MDDAPPLPLAPDCIAFDGNRRIAAGAFDAVVTAAKQALDAGAQGAVLLFDAQTSDRIDVDFSGSLAEVLARPLRRGPGAEAEPGPPAPRGPGRPRLGVVAREVTLLPRHWEWLARQPGGASVALRKLVEEARRMSGGKDRVRQAQEAAYRFMSAMGGNLEGFEEATRALFAADGVRFGAMVAPWPADLREHAIVLAAPVFEAPAS